jgi:uncharacterized protein (TIGR00251 family)
MIAVTPHARGAVLPVRARPGARRDAVLDEYGGALRVAVSAPPEAGKANEAIARLLAETLGRRRSTIHLIAGQSSRSKHYLFEEITVAELSALLSALLIPRSSENGPTPDA